MYHVRDLRRDPCLHACNLCLHLDLGRWKGAWLTPRGSSSCHVSCPSEIHCSPPKRLVHTLDESRLSKFQPLDRIRLALQIFHEDSVHLSDLQLTPQTLVDGDEELLLAVLYRLIAHYDVLLNRVRKDRQLPLSSASPTQVMMAWLHSLSEPSLQNV